MMIGRRSSAILMLVAVIIGQTDSLTCLTPCKCTGMSILCAEKNLDSIPSFATINGAHIVDLSQNEIEEIDYGDFRWKGIEQLQFLYLNVNTIVYIHEDAFAELINLEYLDLSNNLLELLPSRMFTNNSRLTTLNLAGNIFGNNAPIIESDSIESLDISFSKLDTFSSLHIKSLPNLKYLNLQVNNLHYINPNGFNSHVNVELMYNPWACNCSTVEIYKWAQKNKGRISIEDPIRCLSKSHIYVDLLKKAQFHLQKEFCFIDENSFDPTIKELSLTKNDSYRITYDNSSKSWNEPNNRTLLLVGAITFIIITSLAIPIGAGIAYVTLRRRNEKQEIEHLLMEVK